MTSKAFIWGMRLITLIAICATVAIVLLISPYKNQDPTQKVIIHIFLLQITLFFALTGIFSLFLFWLRRKATRNEVVNAHIGISFRQGMLLAFCMATLMALQGFRVLTWWDGLLASGAVLMVELYFLAR